MDTTPSAKKPHDTALFFTIIFGLATVAVFLLQSNGVMTVPWIPSMFGYLLLLAVFSWSFLRWDVPLQWSRWKRRTCLIVCQLGLVSLGLTGTTTQYRREHIPTEIAGEVIAILPEPWYRFFQHPPSIFNASIPHCLLALPIGQAGISISDVTQ